MEQQPQFDDIRPKIGDSVVPLPYTLEPPKVNGAKRYRSRILFATGLGVILTIFDLIWLVGSGTSWLLKPFILAIVVYLEILAIRYLLLEEHQYRQDLERQYSTNFDLSPGDLWGMYTIDKDYPYFCYFRSGRVGIFALFDKNVRIGRDTDAHHYEHYEAIAEGYRFAGSRGATVCHIDHMGSIGVDERLDNLSNELRECTNEDVRDVLTEVYAKLKVDAKNNTASQDVFCLTVRGTTQDLWDAFVGFKDHLLRANYVSFRILNQEELRQLTQDLYNLVEFSAQEASMSAASNNERKIFTPVLLQHADGSREEF